MKGDVMILLTAALAVTILLFVYLLAAMLRPEWF
jgi:K+-transporting ATPase KdpF subunit